MSATRVDPNNFSGGLADALDYATPGMNIVLNGTIPLASTVTLNAGQRIVAGNQNATIEAQGGFSGTSMIQNLGRDDITLEGFKLDGNGRTGLSGINFVSGDNIEMDGLDVGGFHDRTHTGINLNSCTDVNIVDTFVHDVGRGVWVRGASEEVNLTRVKTRRTPAYGISTTGDAANIPFNCGYFDCDVDEIVNQTWGGTSGPRHGLYFTSGGTQKFKQMRVHGNTVIANETAFVDGTGSADLLAVYDMGEFSTVIGNTVKGSGDVGLALWRTEYVHVADNYVDRAHSVGITLLSDTGSTVVGNTCSNNRQNYSGTLANRYGGIRVEQDTINGLAPSTKSFVVGNHCYDNQATPTQDHAVVVEVGNACTVGGNYGEGNTGIPNFYEAGSTVRELDRLVTAPDGTEYHVDVDNAGNLTTVAL